MSIMQTSATETWHKSVHMSLQPQRVNTHHSL